MSVPGLRELLSPCAERRSAAISPVRLLRPSDRPTLDAAAPERHFVFAYGSLISTASRAASLPEAGAALRAELGVGLGLVRSWCFRSPTGFTALGLTPCGRGALCDGDGGGGIGAGTPPVRSAPCAGSSVPRRHRFARAPCLQTPRRHDAQPQPSSASHIASACPRCHRPTARRRQPVNGVVHYAPSLRELDRRESGYSRVAVPLQSLRLEGCAGPPSRIERLLLELVPLGGGDGDDTEDVTRKGLIRVWTYIPDPEFTGLCTKHAARLACRPAGADNALAQDLRQLSIRFVR